MTSEPIRDQITDHLLTPQNSALVVIDYQPFQIQVVGSMDRDLLVQNIGRKKLIMTALWTEMCLAFPSLDALRAGYEVYPVVDAVAGTSAEAHQAGLERIVQAGGQPISWVGLAGELLRDWARRDTVAEVVDIVLTSRLLKAA